IPILSRVRAGINERAMLFHCIVEGGGPPMINLILVALLSLSQDTKKAEEIVRDRSSFLRTAQKTYAAFVGADRANGEVTFRPEGEPQEKSCPIDADAEVRVHGHWGSLEEIAKGDRVRRRRSRERRGHLPS